SWIAEAAAVFVKDWRCELRAKHAVATLGLFAVTSLVVASLALGPVAIEPEQRIALAPVLIWLILLFSTAAGLPRAFVHEEESHTATALRLAATPSALFAGKAAYSFSVLAAVEAAVAPLAAALLQIDVARPGLLAVTLALGGFGLALASTLLAAIVAQGRGRTTLFAALAFPVLVPLLALAVTLTRAAFGAPAPEGILIQLVLYDATVTVAGLMLFPAVWNP
ncbi:MAG: heme exporter protein CcmB, partial [Thermoanaerobaculia bacterium]|nr:heme exporter protein CcmB [Thermoanaerobaculia bacterium]